MLLEEQRSGESRERGARWGGGRSLAVEVRRRFIILEEFTGHSYIIIYVMVIYYEYVDIAVYTNWLDHFVSCT